MSRSHFHMIHSSYYPSIYHPIAQKFILLKQFEKYQNKSHKHIKSLFQIHV